MDQDEVRYIEHKIIENVRRAISDSGKTVERVAYESGVSKGALSEILRHKRSPMLSTLIRIAYGLERPVHEFFLL